MNAPRAGSKSAAIVEIMIANADLEQDACVNKFLHLMPNGTMGEGRDWYKYIVNKGYAPGTPVAGVRKAPVKRTGFKVDLRAIATPKFLEKAEPTPAVTVALKSDDEIAKIKQANAERMRAVSKAKSKSKEVKAEVLLPELDDAADDSFAVPKFLTKDEVKYVV
jgi:hypothetical protein